MADRTIEVVIKAKDQAGATLKKLGSTLTSIGGKLSLGVTAPLMAMGTMAFRAASDLNESMSKVGVVFDEATSKVTAWAAASSQALGMSQQQALEAAGTFGNLFTAMGLTTDEAAGMSTEIVQLAADLGSFNNISSDEALIKLRAGLIGEMEPLRSLGVAIDAETTKLKAMSMGLAATEDALTPAMLIQARYALILEQTKNAQGDFARTSDGAANSLKIAGAELANLASSFGTLLLPILTPAIQALSGLVQKLNSLSKPTKTAIVVLLGVAAVAGPILVAVGSIISAISALSAAFAAGGVLAGVALGPIILVVGAIAAAIALLYLAWTNNWGGIQTRLTAAWAAIQPVLQQVYDWLAVNIPLAIQAVKDWWDNTLIPAFESINEAAIKVGEGITDIIAWFIGLPGRIKDAVTGQLDALVRIGTAIVEGIKTGVQKAWDTFKRWIVQKIESIISSVLGALGIHSPSAVFAEIGFNMVAGLQEGWDAGMAAFTAQVGRGLSMGVPSLSLAGGGGGRGSSTAYNSVGGDTYNVSVNDQTSAALLMAMVDERRRARLYASMGVGV